MQKYHQNGSAHLQLNPRFTSNSATVKFIINAGCEKGLSRAFFGQSSGHVVEGAPHRPQEAHGPPLLICIAKNLCC